MSKTQYVYVTVKHSSIRMTVGTAVHSSLEDAVERLKETSSVALTHMRAQGNVFTFGDHVYILKLPVRQLHEV